jgi:gliding motility-associated-like protein
VQQGASPEYITATIQAGQQVICRLTSSLTCVAQQTITSVPLSLSAAAPPGVKLSEKGYLCAGSTTPLDAGADFSSYSWQDGSTGRYMNIAGEGLYWVVVADTLHCIGSDTVRVQKCAGNIYVPNAFSPNGDGLNDIFRVFASPDDVAEFNMKVFNRWGEKVFESNSVVSGWDGMKAGTYCPAASYVWKINYKVAAAGSAGETVTQTGTLELVR